MLRGLTSLVEIWDEFETGIRGRLSIRQVNEVHKTSWRSKDPERKHYGRQKAWRRKIVRWQLMQNLPTAREAALDLDRLMKLNQKSLNQFKDCAKNVLGMDDENDPELLE